LITKSTKYDFCLYGLPEKGGKVMWQITNKCNYKCSYCIFNSQFNVDTHNELSTQKVFDIIDKLKQNKFSHLKFTGGEPFVRKDMVEIISYAKQKGFFVDISTNASYISKKIATNLEKTKIDFVHVSLDGHNEKLNHLVRGKNTFKATINGIKNLKEKNIYLRLGSVIHKYNEKYIEAIIQLSIKLKINEIVFSKMEAIGRNADDKSLVITKNEKNLVKRIETLQRKYEQKIKIQHNFLHLNKKTNCKLCPGGNKFLFINNQGKVSPCTWMSGYLPQFLSPEIFNPSNELKRTNPIAEYFHLLNTLKKYGLTGCLARNIEEVKNFISINELFNNKLQELKNNKNKFSKFSKLYSFTTENLKAYLQELNLENKKILSTTSSGDFIFNSYLLGAKQVDCFDINLLSKFYFELKTESIKKFTFLKFQQFFLRTKQNNKYTFNYKDYLKLRTNLSALAKLFFDNCYNFFKKDGFKLRESAIFNNIYDEAESKINFNLYLKEKNFYKLKKILKNKKENFINSDIVSLTKHLKHSDKYDLIYLSNIADYAHQFLGKKHLTIFKEEIILLLSKHLNPNGQILMYFYSYDKKAPLRNDFYDFEKVKSILSNDKFFLKILNFNSVIDGKDAIVILKNRQSYFNIIFN